MVAKRAWWRVGVQLSARRSTSTTARPFGVNNKVFPNVAMPDPFLELQGTPVLGMPPGTRRSPKMAASMRDPLVPGLEITEEKCGFIDVVEGTGKLTRRNSSKPSTTSSTSSTTWQSLHEANASAWASTCCCSCWCCMCSRRCWAASTTRKSTDHDRSVGLRADPLDYYGRPRAGRPNNC